jgi:2-C-methyl-D-erythritol 4-phosphate cytidylyltransferase
MGSYPADDFKQETITMFDACRGCWMKSIVKRVFDLGCNYRRTQLRALKYQGRVKRLTDQHKCYQMR